MKRIHRFEVSKYDYSTTNCGRKTDSYKWTRGTELIRTIYKKSSVFFGVRRICRFDDFISMVQECRDGGNILFQIDNNTALEVRHWSYSRKS